MALENRILAVINPVAEQQLALEKALDIARCQGGEVIALVSNKYAKDDLLGKIDQLLSSERADGLAIRLQIAPEPDLFHSIAHYQHHYPVDLVVKQPNALKRHDSFFVPDDWRILRNARCPVLMMRDSQCWQKQTVLLAVDAEPSDDKHALLNERILSAGKKIQAETGCHLHLITVYPAPMQDAQDLGQQSEVILRQRYREDCEQLVSEHQLSLAGLHVEEGPPELIIPDKAKSLNASLVILGTVARSGLSGVLLGNTAEQLLSSLECSLLVLPPSRSYLKEDDN